MGASISPDDFAIILKGQLGDRFVHLIEYDRGKNAFNGRTRGFGFAVEADKGDMFERAGPVAISQFGQIMAFRIDAIDLPAIKIESVARLSDESFHNCFLPGMI